MRERHFSSKDCELFKYSVSFQTTLFREMLEEPFSGQNAIMAKLILPRSPVRSTIVVPQRISCFRGVYKENMKIMSYPNQWKANRCGKAKFGRECFLFAQLLLLSCHNAGQKTRMAGGFAIFSKF